MARTTRRLIVAFRATPVEAASYRDLAESRHCTVSDLLRRLLRKEMRRELAKEPRRATTTGQR